MYNRTIKIIRTLVGHEKMSSVELMDKLKISQRTLRAEIKEANKFLQRENVFIHSSSTGGILCESKKIVLKFRKFWMRSLKKAKE